MICHWKCKLLRSLSCFKRQLKTCLCLRSLSLASFFDCRAPMVCLVACLIMWCNFLICAPCFGWCALVSANLEIKHMDIPYLSYYNILLHYNSLPCGTEYMTPNYWVIIQLNHLEARRQSWKLLRIASLHARLVFNIFHSRPFHFAPLLVLSRLLQVRLYNLKYKLILRILLQ